MSKQKWIINVCVALLLLFSLGCGLNNAALSDNLPEAGEQEQLTEENQNRVNEQEELETEKEEEQDVVEANVSNMGEEKLEAGDNHEASAQQQQEREEKSKQETGSNALKQKEEPTLAEDHHSQQAQEIVPEAADSQSTASGTTVTMTIIGPSDMETFLPDTEVEYVEGETVLDTLKRVTKAHKIQLEYRGRNAGAYVEGINNVYEFDYGAESGWLYSVNGIFPDRSAGIWTVEANDHIRWLYTLDLGKDWGATTPSIQE